MCGSLRALAVHAAVHAAAHMLVNPVLHLTVPSSSSAVSPLPMHHAAKAIAPHFVIRVSLISNPKYRVILVVSDWVMLTQFRLRITSK